MHGAKKKKFKTPLSKHFNAINLHLIKPGKYVPHTAATEWPICSVTHSKN